MKINPVRGTHDLFGEEINKFNKVVAEVKNISQQFGFYELITPIFESSELFKKPLGEQSDVVLKEMYTFNDRNEDEITLRPEYTTPMIRAAISNGLLNNLPAKFFGTGQMFRRERPQKGRYRQFNQINFENFGSDDYFADIEIICLANTLLKNLIPNNNITFNINTLGTRENLSSYKKILSKFFNASTAILDAAAVSLCSLRISFVSADNLSRKSSSSRLDWILLCNSAIFNCGSTSADCALAIFSSASDCNLVTSASNLAISSCVCLICASIWNCCS